MPNIKKVQVGVTTNFIKHDKWLELLPPTDEPGWEYVECGKDGYIWKRLVDTGIPIKCIRSGCTEPAMILSNYCATHKL